MKTMSVMFLASAMASFGARGVERIAVDEVVNHYPWDSKVDCVCTLSGLVSGCNYNGEFTLTVKKDGENIRRVVTNAFASADGTCTNTFDCAALFGLGLYLNGGISVNLVKKIVTDATGDPIGIKSDVLVVDISGGSVATRYPTKEMSGVDLGTFNCDIYKTEKIVLRKIPAGTYYVRPCNKSGADAADADMVANQLLTTKGFYIGVFPVTQRQYVQVMGTNPSYFLADATGNIAAHRPVEKVSWEMIRGNAAAGTSIMYSNVDSFMKRLVEKTDLVGFDLPTEAQWEIACRAGATGAYGSYWDGAEVRLTSSNIGEAAWYSGNASSKTHAVGCKRPNLWGLYDMQGNVWEWCRDVYVSIYNTAYVDTPCTDKSYNYGGYRVLRGGSWDMSAKYSRPSCRDNGAYTGDHYTRGFRISMALP